MSLVNRKGCVLFELKTIKNEPSFSLEERFPYWRLFTMYNHSICKSDKEAVMHSGFTHTCMSLIWICTYMYVIVLSLMIGGHVCPPIVNDNFKSRKQEKV